MAKAILILAIAVVVAGAAVAGWNHMLDPDTLRDTAARMEERAAELRGEQTEQNVGAQKAWDAYDAFLTAEGQTDVTRGECRRVEVGLYNCYGYDAEGRFVHSTGILTDDRPTPTPSTIPTIDPYQDPCEYGLGGDAWESLRPLDIGPNANYKTAC